MYNEQYIKILNKGRLSTNTMKTFIGVWGKKKNQ